MSEETFRGYFPGSKKPLPEGAPVPRKKASRIEGWDDKPVKKIVKGDPIEFFLIGHVCKALGRPPVTIRHWIRTGRMPNAPYKMPDKNDVTGRRLWRREHVEALIEVALKHGLIDNPRVDWSKHETFADDVRKAWASLDLT